MIIDYICQILNIKRRTFFHWQKDENIAIIFFKKYFNEKDLDELIRTGKISKLERLEELEEIEKKYKAITEITKGNNE